MNGDNLAPWLYLAGDHGTLDPGTGNSLDVKRSPSTCPLVLASVTATETRTLPRPTKANAILVVYIQGPASITTGTITLTVTGGFNPQAQTALVFTAQYQWATFVSGYDGTNYFWMLQANSELPSTKLVTATTTLAVTTVLHANRTILLSGASGVGFTSTMPAATGSGNMFTFIVATGWQSTSYIIDFKSSTQQIQGVALVAAASGGTSGSFPTINSGTNSNEITLNGTTTGGLGGDIIEVQDVGTLLYTVKRCLLNGSGSAATPFGNH